MSIFSGGIMKENELSKFSQIGIVLLVIIPALVAAVVNISRGYVPHPSAFMLVILGFVLFLTAKLSVIIRHKKWVSFGSHPMTENMANVYRLGYWLIIVGILFTFV